MSEHARCAAILRNGVGGNSVVAPGSDFCAPHRDLAVKCGEAALRRGKYPRRPGPASVEPLVVETEGMSTASNGAADPSTVRPRLAAAAAEGLDGIRRSLLEAATGATREHWVTFTCPYCAKKQRLPVTVPDVRCRVAAIEVLLREGLGRAPQSEAPPTLQLPKTVAQVKQMGWEEMQYDFATLYADEIEAVVRDGGEQALGERVSRLGQPERTLLLNALASA
jgi:hypothetical protein